MGGFVAADPLNPAATFGAPGTTHLLLFGAVGFVVAGTLYHVVPFIVWVHRYSDRLGFEPVPMIDDLYDARLAAVDFAALSIGLGGLVAIELLPAVGLSPTNGWSATPAAVVLAGLVSTVGVSVFAINLGLTVSRHSPGSVLSGGRTDDSGGDASTHTKNDRQ